MPQIAMLLQNAAYPPNLIAALLPYNAGISFILILHQLIAALGMMLLVLRLGWGLWPAIISAMSLALCGFNFSVSSNFHLVETASWCPLTIWAILNIAPVKAEEKKSQRSYAKSGLLASVAITMLLIAGHPELALSNLLIIGAVSLWLAFKEDRRNDDCKQILGWRIGSIIAGGFMAMPVILPVMEWFALSRRSEGLLPQEVFLMSSSFYDLLCILLPQPLGDLQLRGAEFRELVMSEQFVPYVGSTFIGPVAITLALWGLLDHQWKWRNVALLALIASLVVTLGNSTQIMPFLFSLVPILGILRFPIKWMFFPLLILSLLAGRGAKCTDEGKVPCKITILLWTIVTIVGAYLTFLGSPSENNAPNLQAPQDTARQLLWLKAYSKIGFQCIIAGGIGLLVSVIALPAAKARLSLVQNSVTLLLLSSLLFASWGLRSNAASGDFFKQASYVDDFLVKAESGSGKEKRRYAGLFVQRFSVPQYLLNQDSLQSTISSYQYSRQVLRSNCNIEFERPSSLGFEASAVGDYYHYFINAYGESLFASGWTHQPDDTELSKICRITSTNYALSQVYRYKSPTELIPVEKADSKFFDLILEDAKNNIRVYKVRDALARAYLAQELISRSDLSNAVETMNKRDFDPSKATIITARQEIDVPNQVLGTEGSGSPDSASILEESANKILINTNSQNDRILVLNDQFYPGWKAFVDGIETTIMRANCFMRAVKVPAGKHLVEFVYVPMSFYGGLTISALTLLLLLYKIMAPGATTTKQHAEQSNPS